MDDFPRLYSLTRYATPPRQRNAAFARANEAARKHAASCNLPLDETLAAASEITPLEGAISGFAAEVDRGRIAPGSILLVDRLNDLGRGNVLAVAEALSDVVAAGIPVLTDIDGRRHEAGSRSVLAELAASLGLAAATQTSSQVRAQRLRAVWAQKRERAGKGEGVLTARAPAWLRFDKTSERFIAVDDRAAAVRRIFALAEAGLGKTAIAQALEREGIASFTARTTATGNGAWRPSYIQKILDAEAVTGRYQPMRREIDPTSGAAQRVPAGPPIDGYFPTIVPAQTFVRVRNLRAARRTSPRQSRHPSANMFAGLATCGACGAPMHYRNKGTPPRGGTYLVCSAARRSTDDGCSAATLRYDIVAHAVFGALGSPELGDAVGRFEASKAMSTAPGTLQATRGASREADLNAGVRDAVRVAIETLSIYRGDTARDRIDRPVRNAALPMDSTKNRLYRAILQNSRRAVSLEIALRGHDCTVFVYADGTAPGRFVALALRTGAAGAARPDLRLCLRAGEHRSA